MIKFGKMGLDSVYLAPADGSSSMPSFPSMGDTATGTPTSEGQDGQNAQSPANEQNQGSSDVAKNVEGSSTAQDNDKKDGFYPWTNVLPDKYKRDERFKGFKNISEFLGSVLPGENANGETEGSNQPNTENGKSLPAEYKDFNKKLVETEDPKGIRSKLLIDTLQKHGVPQEEAEALFESFNSSIKEDVETIIQDNAVRCQNVLEKEWGIETQAKQRQAERAFMLFSEQEPAIGQELKQRGILTVPAFWKALSIIGSTLSEDTSISSRESNKNGTFDASTKGRLIPDFPKIKQ